MRRSRTELRPGRSRTGFRVAVVGIASLVLLSVLILFHDEVFGRTVDEPPRAAGAPDGAPLPASDVEAELVQFTAYVADHVQATFEAELGERGHDYAKAKLVHFTGQVRAPCGMAEVVTGTFYCAREQRVYVDLGLYRELRRGFGASGDFAEAYALAHVLGHHLQSVQGIDAWVRRRGARNPARQEDLTERAELQADCYAAVWARIATERELLHPGDLESGMEAASKVGAQRGRRATGDTLLLEPFTHASPRRRAEWFERGFESGRIEACDTFARDAL